MEKGDKFNIRYLEREEYPSWDHFVEESAEGCFFHSSVWLETLAQWQNADHRILGCFRDQSLLAGMGIICRKKSGVQIMLIPPKTPFYGPVLGEVESKQPSKIESRKQALANALYDFISGEFKWVQFLLTPAVSDIRPYQWRSANTGVHYTFIVPLEAGRDLHASFDSSIRRQIKKGEKLAYTFSKENSAHMIRAAFEMEQASFQRQKLQLNYAGIEQKVEFISELVLQGAAQTYSMICEERIVASQIVILDRAKHTAYYWLSGAIPEYLSTGLNQVLMKEVLEDLGKEAYTAFDFVGAGTESIARYKTGFNFPLVPYYSVSRMSKGLQAARYIKRFISKA